MLQSRPRRRSAQAVASPPQRATFHTVITIASLAALVGVALSWVTPTPAFAQTLTTLASFNFANGGSYAGPVVDSGGNLFGTTASTGVGGTSGGTLFEWVKSSGTISVLANLDDPAGGLVEDSSGNLFGTTTLGGGYGTVFEWVKSSGSITVLATFNGNNGFEPAARLVEDSSGNLFGTTYMGGTTGVGHVFEWVKSSGTITVLASFNGSNGYGPEGGLVEDSSGNLFGAPRRGRHQQQRHGVRVGQEQRHHLRPRHLQRQQRAKPTGRTGRGQQRQSLRHHIRGRYRRRGHGVRVGQGQRQHLRPRQLQRQQRGTPRRRPGRGQQRQSLRHDIRGRYRQRGRGVRVGQE